LFANPSATRRLRLGLILVLSLVAVVGAAAPVAASDQPAPRTELERVIAVAKAEVGSKYSFASAGPTTFDCSGFVTYVYKQAGLLDRIGGKRRTVAGYLEWFRAQGAGRATTTDARPGDLIIWGRNKHIGIYLGDGMAISALINPYGVKIHRVTGYIGMRVKAYLHVRLER
jgi:cell wall-associated NlpC family hydrolase